MNVWLIGLVSAVVLFQVVAIAAILRKRNDFADVLWGPAFPLSAFAAAYWGLDAGFRSLDTRAILILSLITIWAVRLFFHIGVRNLSSPHEDVRYANWRKQWGGTQVWRSYLQVFVLQPLILYIFLLPVLLSLDSVKPLGWLACLGFGIWILGFILESVADEQLRRFKKDLANKGQLMTTGVWSWSRHPNYFGEVAQWWGIWLMVLELPYGWATILSPVGVTYLVVKVSGVEMLENLMRSRPGFAEYANRTSAFFPLPPKQRPS